MSDISSRLNLIADHYGLKTYADFAKKTGLSHQNASNYLKGKQKPDIIKLSLIKQSFDLVNANWLLTGKGDMLDNNVLSEPLETYQKPQLTIDELINNKIDDKLSELIADIAKLKQEVFRLNLKDTRESMRKGEDNEGELLGNA